MNGGAEQVASTACRAAVIAASRSPSRPVRLNRARSAAPRLDRYPARSRWPVGVTSTACWQAVIAASRSPSRPVRSNRIRSADLGVPGVASVAGRGGVYRLAGQFDCRNEPVKVPGAFELPDKADRLLVGPGSPALAHRHPRCSPYRRRLPWSPRHQTQQAMTGNAGADLVTTAAAPHPHRPLQHRHYRPPGAPWPDSCSSPMRPNPQPETFTAMVKPPVPA